MGFAKQFKEPVELMANMATKPWSVHIKEKQLFREKFCFIGTLFSVASMGISECCKKKYDEERVKVAAGQQSSNDEKFS